MKKKSGMTSLQEKIGYSVSLLQKAESMALRLDPENGFYLAFSGGKDSQALYHLAQMAGVKFKAHMNLTSVDPPEVIRFVRRQYPGVELIKPRMSIYDMACRKQMLPTKTIRWCCAEFKEASGAGTVTLTGIRRQESIRRSKRGEIEISSRKFSGNFDQWNEHQEKMVACVGGKDKILVSPILYWTEHDVWQFLDEVVKVPHCELYDEGWEPQFTEDEWRYYPWFYLYTQQELDDMDEDEKQERCMIDISGRNDGYYCGFGCANSNYVPSSTRATVGSRLCLKSPELAAYCSRQFIELWADFCLTRKGDRR